VVSVVWMLVPVSAFVPRSPREKPRPSNRMAVASRLGVAASAARLSKFCLLEFPERPFE